MLTSSDTTTLAKRISKEILESTKDKIDLDEYCTVKLELVYPDLSDLQIADELDEIVKKVKFYINKRKEYCEKHGITPEYEFNTYFFNVLLSYSLKYKESVLTSFLRKQRRSLLKAINEMHWQSFECFCKHLLESNEVSPVKLTKVNQEGIDFCGLYAIGKHVSSVVIPKNFKIRIVGQVKHYSSKINPKLVRAFNTYCEDVKNEKEDIIKDLPEWFTKNKTPVLGIFMTTSDFTSRAIEYAKKEWIILRKGEQIVECLIESPNIRHWFKNEGGYLTFNRASFLESFEKSDT